MVMPGPALSSAGVRIDRRTGEQAVVELSLEIKMRGISRMREETIIEVDQLSSVGTLRMK